VVIGGVNGTIKVLDTELQPLSEFSLYNPKLDLKLSDLGKIRGIKSICVDKSGRKILYGTTGGEIGEIDFEKGVDINSGPVVTGHCKDQTYVLASHPIRQECLTAGDDKTIRIWNLEKREMSTMLQLSDIIRCAAYSPNGQIVVAGLGGYVKREGEWIARLNEDGEPVTFTHLFIHSFTCLFYIYFIFILYLFYILYFIFIYFTFSFSSLSLSSMPYFNSLSPYSMVQWWSCLICKAY
jgi:hypothetical protein